MPFVENAISCSLTRLCFAQLELCSEHKDTNYLLINCRELTVYECRLTSSVDI